MPKATTIEILTAKGWQVFSVEDALAQGQTEGRCVECHQPAKAFKASEDRRYPDHVEHRRRNRSCSLSDKRTS